MHYIFIISFIAFFSFFHSCVAKNATDTSKLDADVSQAPQLDTDGAASQPQDEKNQEAVKSIVQSLYQSAKKICENKNTSEDEKMAQLTRRIQASWDVVKIAEYIMHPHWKSFSALQKDEFIKILTKNVVRTFQKVSKKYLGSFKIVSVSPIPNKKDAYDVDCEVMNKEDKRKVDVRFQVVSKKVRNLFVEKLNLVDAKKKDFMAVMRKNRKSIPNFLKAIENQGASIPTQKKK